MNFLGVMHSDSTWWRAHMALPQIVAGEIENPTAGVEVGTGFGSMAIWMTRFIPTLSMLCVDSFCEYNGDDGMSDVMREDGKTVEDFVRWRFANEGDGRLSLLKTTSTEAASIVADGSQDFVFIDADHRYESVLNDITLWLPKVRSGGLICGHDFCDTWPGVKRAVGELLRHLEPRVDVGSTIWHARVS